MDDSSKSDDPVSLPSETTGEDNHGFVVDEDNNTKNVSPSEIEVPIDNSEQNEGEDRANWDKPLEFLLSCVSMSVGLGNVWRFPFTAYENGGGAFLIPYFIVLILIGRPIYFLEMALGQFSSSGPQPNNDGYSTGVGFGSCIGCIVIISYYCSIMAVCVFYFINSFSKTLPWSECNPGWADEELDICGPNSTWFRDNNVTIPQLYYEREVFPQKTNIDDGIGTPEWRLTLCLAFSWAVIFFSLWKGVQSSGKVAYFTAIFPYTVLFILLIRGVTLKGAWTGIEYFIKPDWSKIYDPKVWYAAVSQCFFSMGTGFGVIPMFSSFNPFRQNVYKDALIVSLMDTFTSVLAGVTIFSVLGSLAYDMGTDDISAVAKGGPSLAFVSYPEAIAKFDFVNQLFAVLFFLMLFTLGVGTATALCSQVIGIICDEFPSWVRWKVTGVVTTLGFLVGIIYVTPGGQFLLTLVDYFGGNFVIYVMAMIEVGAVAWVYGVNRFIDDIHFMIGIRIGWYWKICWGFFIPVGLFVILIYSFATSEEIQHEGVNYPTAAIVCGWILAAFALIMVPVWALRAVMTQPLPASTFAEKVKQSLKPSADWGPRSVKNRKLWLEYNDNKELQRKHPVKHESESDTLS